jgi:hypothetical protein
MLNNNQIETRNKIEPYIYGGNPLLTMDHQIDQQQKHFNLGLENTYKVNDADFESCKYSGN